MTSWKKSFLFWGGDIIIIMSYIYVIGQWNVIQEEHIRTQSEVMLQTQ